MWLSKYQYFPKVFVLPPWKAIYENDAERDHTFEHADSSDHLLRYCDPIAALGWDPQKVDHQAQGAQVSSRHS
jgi:predicted ATPase